MQEQIKPTTNINIAVTEEEKLMWTLKVAELQVKLNKTLTTREVLMLLIKGEEKPDLHK